MTNGGMYRFLTTGQFNVWVPGKASINYTNDYLSKGGKCLDFIGLNYYCHGYMSGFKTHRDTTREIPTDSPNYTIYGEGLYRAIKELSDNVAAPCRVPIYVTENGIGTSDDTHRDLFYHRYMYALARAINAGYDVRGYVTWSFMDNYEWGDFEKRYGMYHVDFETQQRTLKPGAQYLVDLMKASSH
jgi:beta-glucosidase